MALVKCKECGKKISDGANKCPNCGYKEKKRIKIDKNIIKKIGKKKLIIGLILIILIVSGIIGVVTIHNKKVEAQKKAEQERYDKLPIKVDISMTSYYGDIDYILYELDLDFDLVTMGANCYTGVQKGEFKTEKYGILYTEFRYCKSNYTQTFRVYNDTKDQELREPKPGELAEFDKYGEKITDNNTKNGL